MFSSPFHSAILASRGTIHRLAAVAAVLTLSMANTGAQYVLHKIDVQDNPYQTYGYALNDAGRVAGVVLYNYTGYRPYFRHFGEEGGLLPHLPPTGNTAGVYGINSSHQIVGSSGTSSPYSKRAAIWNWQGWILGYEAVDLNFGFGHSEAKAINDMGTIVGFASNSSQHAALWRPGAFGYEHVALDDNGIWFSCAYYVSPDSNLIGGGARYHSSTGAPYGHITGVERGVVWENVYGNYVFSLLPVLETNGVPDFESTCRGLNSSGILIGATGDSAAGESSYLSGVYWKKNWLSEWTLYPLPQGGHDICLPYDINEGGIIVGGVEDSITGYERAVVWEPAAYDEYHYEELPRLSPDDLYGWAYNVNEVGQIVGYSGDHAVLWQKVDGTWQVIDLGIPQGCNYSYATKINSQGQILVGAVIRIYPYKYQTHLAVPNTPPMLWSPGSQAITECQSFELALDFYDPDMPIQTMSFSISSGPEGLTVDPTEGIICWEPTEDQGPGLYDVTVSVSDGHASCTVSFDIYVMEDNAAPVLILPATTFNSTVGSQLTFTADATDADGHPLTFALVNPEAGATIDALSGIFTWTPTTGGTFTFDIRVMDGFEASDTGTVTVNVSEPLSPLTLTVGSITRRSKTITVPMTVKNTGATPISGVTVASATLDGAATSTKMPLAIAKTLKGGASVSTSLTFSGVKPGKQLLMVKGSSSGGPFTFPLQVNVP